MKKRISTQEAPAAVGPYSQAIAAGNTVYLSGQIGLDPATGTLVKGGVVEQTRQCLKNIRGILNALNTGPESVVKTTVYLAHIEDFASVNAVYGEFFTGDAPARSCVAVQALPLGSLVEIEALVVL